MDIRDSIAQMVREMLEFPDLAYTAIREISPEVGQVIRKRHIFRYLQRNLSDKRISFSTGWVAWDDIRTNIDTWIAENGLDPSDTYIDTAEIPIPCDDPEQGVEVFSWARETDEEYLPVS